MHRCHKVLLSTASTFVQATLSLSRAASPYSPFKVRREVRAFKLTVRGKLLQFSLATMILGCVHTQRVCGRLPQVTHTLLLLQQRVSQARRLCHLAANCLYIYLRKAYLLLRRVHARAGGERESRHYLGYAVLGKVTKETAGVASSVCVGSSWCIQF